MTSTRALFLAAFVSPAPLLGATLRVPSEHATIQGGIDAAAAGDVVLVAPGEYVIDEPVRFNRRFTPPGAAKNIILKSEAGPEVTVIRMSAVPLDRDLASTVAFEGAEDPSSRIEGFTILAGRGTANAWGDCVDFCGQGVCVDYFLAYPGGAVLCKRSSPVIADCVLEERTPEASSVLACFGGAPAVERCRIRATESAGVYCYQSDAIITDCDVRAGLSSALILEQGSLFVARSVLAESWSGVECLYGASLTISGTRILENESAGLSCQGDASILMGRCTITGNRGPGMVGWYCSSLTVASSIVWENGGPPIQLDASSAAGVSYSCLETETAWDGPGNIQLAPLFAGWQHGSEVWVDASSPLEGDGSAGSPFRELRKATEGYSLDLTAASPCLGSGLGGVDMGADHATSAASPVPERRVHVAKGLYSTEGLDLNHRVSLGGAGRELVVLAGDLSGIHGGTMTSSLRVEGTVGVGWGSHARVKDCAMASAQGVGLICGASSSTEIERCAIRGVTCGAGSNIVLTACDITGSTAYFAGGVDAETGAQVLLEDCVLEDGVRQQVQLGALHCRGGSTVTLRRSTLTRNVGGAVLLKQGASLTLESSIVWGNTGGGITAEPGSALDVSFSCVEGEQVPPGPGNIALDPMFCGWTTEDVFVDPSRPAGGDGSAASPFASLAKALEYGPGLRDGSPCRGAGAGGVDMGADRGTCGAPGAATRTVHLAAGEVSIAGITLAQGASLEGSGRDATLVHGTVFGLGDGARLSRLTVTDGEAGGVVLSSGSPEIVDCSIERSYPAGILCEAGAPRVLNTAIRDNYETGIDASGESTPRFEGCEIDGNRGMGVHCRLDAAPTFLRCSVSRNGLTGIHAGDTSAPSFMLCEVAGNGGSGLVCMGSSAPDLDACTIRGNAAPGDGGGANVFSGTPTFRGCLIVDNAAAGRGGGVFCLGRPTLRFSTVSGNHAEAGGGAFAGAGSDLVIESCIVWGNLGGSVDLEDRADVRIDRSCVEGPEEPPGLGNNHEDPLFCAWGGAGDAFVDATGPAGGDGSRERPFREIGRAFEFGYGLAAGSPCLGKGEGGLDMGAPGAGCAAPGVPARRVHVAGGEYEVRGNAFAHGVSLEGAGVESTTLLGGVRGLRTGAELAAVRILGGQGGGLEVPSGEAPLVRNVDVTGCFQGYNYSVSAVTIGRNAAPRLEGVVVERNAIVYSPETNAAMLVKEGATPVLERCRIAGNSGVGLVCLEGSAPRMEACTLAENLAGIWCGNGSRPVIDDCAVFANQLGLFHQVRAEASVQFSTIARNAINLSGDTVPAITGSIFWGSVRRPLLPPPGASPVDHSCMESDPVWPGDGNIAVDPLFVLPGRFDFERQVEVEFEGQRRWLPAFVLEAPDLHLQPGSWAIDAGGAAGVPAEDVEGHVRPCWGGPDMGAFEYCGGLRPERALAFRRGDATADGVEDITDAIVTLGYLFLGSGEPPCLDAADADDTGRLDLTDAVYSLQHLFAGGPASPPPRDCGMDLTADGLGCKAFPICAGQAR